MTKSMSELSDIYFTSIIKKTIFLQPEEIKGDINDNILKIVKKEYEGKCIEEGYVKPDSCQVTRRSLLKLVPNILSGAMYSDVRIKADICLPVKGNVFSCKIEKINKMGLMAEEGPLSIVIPRSFHKDKDVFKDMELGDTIQVEVIASRFDINWEHVDVIAQLYDPNKPKKAKVKEMKIIETENPTDILEELSDNEEDVLQEEGDELDDDEDNVLDDDNTLDDETVVDEDDEEEDEEILLDEDDLDEEGNMMGGSEYVEDEEESEEDEDSDELSEVESDLEAEEEEEGGDFEDY